MIIKILLGFVVVIIIYFALLSFNTRHHVLKDESQRSLNPCIKTTNCVLSSASDNTQIDPIQFNSDNSIQNWESLVNAVSSLGGDILINDGQYLHAVFSSSIFRFKDDLEAILVTDNKIDIRSASRAGKSDFGQNRKRIEQIRNLTRN